MKTTQIASFNQYGNNHKLWLHSNGRMQILVTNLNGLIIKNITQGNNGSLLTPIQLIEQFSEKSENTDDILKKIEIFESGENDISLWLTPNGKQHYFLSDSEKVIEYKVSLEPIEETSFDETELEQLGLALSFQ